MFSLGQVAVLGLGLVSGEEQEPKQTVFRVATRLVEVTVSVLNKNGNPVAGLGPADFVVLDEGKRRPVAVFRFDGRLPTPATGAPAPTLPPGTFTNRPAVTDAAPRNVTAVVLDNVNTTVVQGIKARAQAMRYLAILAPQAITAVYLMEGGGLYVLHDFTDDAAVLSAKVEQARLGTLSAWETDDRILAERFNQAFPQPGHPAIGVATFEMRMDAIVDARRRAQRTERSLAMMETLGTHLAGIPGRKSLVWIGGGISMVSIAASRANTLELLETLEAELRRVSQGLAQQGIVLYVVDSHELETSQDVRADSRLGTGTRTNFDLLMDTRATSEDTRASMEMMASIAGGRYFRSSHPASDADKIVSDFQGSYTLGFYVPEAPDDKWHKLKVQVKRPGLNVRHREGYLSDSETVPLEWTDEMWRTAFSNPLGSPTIALTADCKKMASGELALSVRVDTSALQFVPDGENLRANLEIHIGDRTAEGFLRNTRSTTTRITVPAAELDVARRQGSRHDMTWKPAPAATTLRVIVLDVNSGRHGTLDVPLDKVPRDRLN